MPTQEELNGQLVKAAEKGDADAVKALLDAGADADAADKEGETALMFAADGGHTETAQALLAAGANVNARTGYSALWRVADWKVRLGMVVFVSFWGFVCVVMLCAPVMALAVIALSAVAATQSLKSGKLWEVLLAVACTVLVARWVGRDAWRNAREAPKLFAKLFASLFRGETALMKAADGGHTATVQALLAAGADTEAKDDNGETALMKAADGGHTATVQALLAAGADMEAKDDNGKTALTYAEGHADVVKLLEAAARERAGRG